MNRRFFLSTSALWAGLGATALAKAPEHRPRPVARGAKPAAPEAQGLAQIIRGWSGSGTASVALMDVDSGEMLESYAPELSMPPASTAKVLTSLYAYDALGLEHRFRTRIMAIGPVLEGRLQGDLLLAGGGDPHFDTDAMADLVARLKTVGIRSITGQFKVYDAALPRIARIDPEQPEYVGYNPSLSGMNLNFNRVYFQWKRDGDRYDVTMTAKSRNYNPPVRTARMSIAERGSPVFDYNGNGALERWSVARSALGRNGSRWLPLRRPWACAGQVLRDLARAKGITLPAAVQSNAPAEGRVLAEVQSTDLLKMSRAMLRYSTNLTAEALGTASTIRRGARPSSLSGSAAQMNGWLEMAYGVPGFGLSDHSGLNETSRVSAEAMVKVLRQAAFGPLRSALRKHPVGKRGAPVKIDVFAKTGTLNFVRGLAGYVTADDGRLLAFAIYSADMKTRAAIPKSQRERPRGAKGWANRAVRREQDILTRWASVY